jgi:NosL
VSEPKQPAMRGDGPVAPVDGGKTAAATHSTQEQEEEYYVEPPRMGAGDAAGVIGALLALLVIGVAGFVWLNPEMDFKDLRERFSRGDQSPSAWRQAPVPDDPDAQAGSPSPTRSDSRGIGLTPPPQEARPRCAACGMFTDMTLGAVRATWSDGSQTTHDCWTCALDYGRDSGLTRIGATVLDYGAGLEARKELDAKSAWFLYDTERIEGSMPPFIAAFSDRASAETAQVNMGGEVADFAALMAKLSSVGGN